MEPGEASFPIGENRDGNIEKNSGSKTLCETNGIRPNRQICGGDRGGLRPIPLGRVGPDDLGHPRLRILHSQTFRHKHKYE